MLAEKNRKWEKTGKIIKFYLFYLMSKFKITDIVCSGFYSQRNPKCVTINLFRQKLFITKYKKYALSNDLYIRNRYVGHGKKAQHHRK
jgi:hypothetical protein